MYLLNRWARALAITSVLTLFLAGTMSASAGADGTNDVIKHGRTTVPVSSPANKQAGRTHGTTLIFGGGHDQGGRGLPTEPVTDLEDILTNAGYAVDVSAKLPPNLRRYKAIWFIGTYSVSNADQTELEGFVNSGRGLYLTGAGQSNDTQVGASDAKIINALVAGGGVQTGGQGSANDPTAPEPINPAAIDDVGAGGGTWTPSDPGGMTGVTGDNVLTSTSFGDQTLPTGAVWDGSAMTDGKGRLAILMDLNWLATEDQVSATRMVVNLERFLRPA